MLKLVIAASLLALQVPGPFVQMADTERAFAKRASEVGIRDSFLEYFADSAVRFDAEPSPAKPFLEKLKSQPPSVVELVWEPRFGDISASGDIGYLTGPASRIVHSDPAQPVTELAYFSIWKRQADGTFKVFIDQGITTPMAVPFPSGLTRADASDRYAGRASDADATLQRADRDRTPPLTKNARVYRDGKMPFVGDAAQAQLVDAERDRTTESLHVESATSGDLGISYGRYAMKTERGHYVRVWTRNRAGRWLLAFDVTAPRR